MKINTNEKKAKRNSVVAYWIIICSLLHIIAGAYFLFRYESLPEISLVLFCLGLILFQVGKSHNKWRLRTDIILNNALQKLGDDYSLYHYSSPVSHLLVGPAGIWVIVPSHVRGKISYDKRRKRWKMKHPSLLSRFLSCFINRLGRPDLEIIQEVDSLTRYFQKVWELDNPPQVNVVLVFINELSEVSTPKAPVESLQISELREFIRKKEREARIPYKVIKSAKAFFTAEGN